MANEGAQETEGGERIPIYAMMVLLVDDQPMVGEAVRRLLADQPQMELHYCSDPLDAVCLANEIKPTVILQDLVMPKRDGLDVVRSFRANPVTAETPIVVLSIREDPETKSRAFAAGANDYLVKLPDKIELVARIAYHSKAHLSRVQRDEAYRSLRESQQQLLDANTALVATNARLEEALRSGAAESEARQLAVAQLRQSEERLRAILEHTPAVVYVKDLDSRFLLVNRRFEVLFGLTNEQILGQTDHDVFPKDLADACRANDLEVIEAGVALEFEEVARQGHELHTYISHKFPLRDPAGNLYAICGISTDITERKQAAEALNQARHEAERANYAKSDFLSRMSHELRTPLNAILGFGQLLDMDQSSGTDRESVQQILKAGRHLLELINEVLDISRIEAGRLSFSPEPVHLSEVVTECAQLLRPLAEQRRVSVNGDFLTTCDLHVIADRQRLKQVLLNLLSNAIKYNRDGGSVMIACDKRPNEELRITVTDTGAGIAADNLVRVFLPFDRLNAEQTGVEGTGLGMAVTKRLVELMAGSIGVESVVGQGSTFWVDLPIAETPSQTIERHMGEIDAESNSTARETLTGRTLVYIEDNLSNLRLIERILLQQPGIKLIAAMLGTLGLDLAREHRPDLILLDLNLPDLSGREILHRLKAEPITRDIPVVVISADATPGEFERLRAAGAKDYLTKPIDVRSFIKVLTENLRNE